MKYKLTRKTKTIEWNGQKVTLYRIKSLVHIPYSLIDSGDFGGWIEKESNLSQDEFSWVGDDACVFGNAVVEGGAKVGDNVIVCDNAIVRGFSGVWGNVVVCDNAIVEEVSMVKGSVVINKDIRICGNAIIRDEEDLYKFLKK